MNTTELKKLAEAAGKEVWAFGSFAGGEIRIGPYEDLKHSYFATMLAEGEFPWNKTESSKDAFNKASYIAAANPAAILKLLQINAELLDALKKTLAYPENWPASFKLHDCWKRDAEAARAALVKAEGGEL